MAKGRFCRQRNRRLFRGTLLMAACAAGLVVAGSAMADAGFQQRANMLLDWAIQDTNTNPKHGFWLAQARFAMGLEEEARQQVAECLDRLHLNDPPFQRWACIDT